MTTEERIKQIASWMDDPRFKRDIGADPAHSVTDRAAGVSVTRFNYWNTCICDLCGKEFRSKRRKQGTKFCSSACRQKHYRQNKKLYL
jgi:hypothetical protein